MNRGKRIDVSASTLVDLKAELFRKQEEFRRSKLKNDGFKKPVTKLDLKTKETAVVVDNLGKSNSGVASRQAKDGEGAKILEEDDEVRNALQASRKKLEEKTKLYDKLTSGSHLPDEDEIYMVDFQRKILNETSEKRNNVTKRAEEVRIEDQTEEWVDYTDSLGRSRRCLKADLPSMIEMDDDLKRSKELQQFRPPDDERLDRSDGDEDEFIGPMPAFEEQQPTTPLGPLHYQNVKENEIRNHGVGYFAFSQAEEERQKQLDLLNTLRNQTKEQRERSEKMKAKRKDMMKTRLAKVKQRKRLKAGDVLSDEDKSDDDFADLEVKETVIAPEVETVVPIEEEPKPAKIRPWDKGKIGVSKILQPFKKASQKNYVEKQRSERLTEFAPPEFYYKNRDRVAEMHSFFKDAWKESLEQTEIPDELRTESTSSNIDDIPLPSS